MTNLNKSDILMLLERLKFKLISDSPQEIIAKRDLTRSDISPTISTVIVTAGRTSLIECVESVCNYDYPSFEVIVIFDRGRNLSHARNQGIRNSKGALIHFIDDDAIPAVDNLSEMVCRWLNLWNYDSKIAGLQGFISRTAWGTNKMITRISLEFTGVKTTSIYGEGLTDHVCTCNSLFSADILRRIDGFDELFDYRYEDVDLSFTIKHSGYRLYATQKGYVHHLMDPSKSNDASNLVDHAMKDSVILFYKWGKISTFLLYFFCMFMAKLMRVSLSTVILNKPGIQSNLVMLPGIVAGLGELPKASRASRMNVFLVKSLNA